MMWDAPRSRSTACGRSRPWVPEIRPTRIAGSGEGDAEAGAVTQGLVDDAVPLGQLEELCALGFRRVAVELDREADLAEPDGRVLRHAERAAEVEIALGAKVAAAQRDPQRRRHRGERDARARDERL